MCVSILSGDENLLHFPLSPVSACFAQGVKSGELKQSLGHQQRAGGSGGVPRVLRPVWLVSPGAGSLRQHLAGTRSYLAYTRSQAHGVCEPGA